MKRAKAEQDPKPKARPVDVQVVPIAKLRANPKNPRVMRDEKFARLKKSIQDFPDMLNYRSIVAVTDTDGKLMVLGGNMRLRALQDLGIKEAPVMLADHWTEEQRREFIVKDNVGFGEWDWDMLANEWDGEQLSGWGLDVPTPTGDDADPFADEGIKPQGQFGVIITCGNEEEQSATYEKLTGEGYTCKVVCT